jgi:Holliday junction resolvasome RuvABC endonuclease subunit
VQKKSLYKVSEVEQDLVGSGNYSKSQLQTKVFNLIDDNESQIPKMEKLRVALLLAIRFE